MNLKKKNIFIIITLIILAIILTSVFYIVPMISEYIENKNTTSSNNSEESKSNTDVAETNTEVAYTKSGAKIKIVTVYDENMFKGQKSLIFFWASWCSHCQDEVEVIKESMKEYSNKGFNIYAISHDNDLNELISFMEKENIEFDVYYDKGRIIRKNLDPEASTVPLLYVINEDLSIAKKFDGPANKDTVNQFVNYIKINK